MVLAARGLARAVTTTTSDTLVAPFLTDVEGEGLGVLGDVGRDVVLANTLVGEGVRVAFVVDGGHGGDAGLLEADERALSNLVGTPCGSVAAGDAVGVNGVGVVELLGGLCSREASDSGNSEGKGRTHIDGVAVKLNCRVGSTVRGARSEEVKVLQKE